MNVIGVITGDITNSKKISKRPELASILQDGFATINKRILKNTGKFEIYRGDSFQGLIKDPSKSLLTAILLRARLRQWEVAGASVGKLPDARIGIGIGAISFNGKKVVESDGEAFQYSGMLLDKMKKSEQALSVQTPWQEINEELRVSTRLADAIISKWTAPSAEAAFYYLTEGKTQEKISKKIGISQPAIHKRLTLANVEAIEIYLNRFEKLVNTAIQFPS